MCGRYTITVTYEELLMHYYIDEDTNSPWHKPRYNVTPGVNVPAIIHDGQKNRIGELKWGLVPSWTGDVKTANKPINAMAETVDVLPSFRSSFKRKRCIIPADGFVEFRKSDGQPFRIILPEQNIFSMAALWDSWIAPDGSKLNTCVIITTEPNVLMASIEHHRMPVILNRDEEAEWLDKNAKMEHLKLLLRQYPSEKMRAYKVPWEIRNSRNQGAELVEEIK